MNSQLLIHLDMYKLTGYRVIHITSSLIISLNRCGTNHLFHLPLLSFRPYIPDIYLLTQLQESDITLGQFPPALNMHLLGHWQLQHRATMFYVHCVQTGLLTYLLDLSKKTSEAVYKKSLIFFKLSCILHNLERDTLLPASNNALGIRPVGRQW